MNQTSVRKHRIALLGCCLLLAAALCAPAASETVSLDGEWGFTFRNMAEEDTPDLPDASAYDITLRVPDYWRFNVDRYVKAAWWPELKTEPAVMLSLYGTGFYRKKIEIPGDWSGRAVRLWIGRAHGRVNVWLNGEHLGYYRFAGGFFPLAVDLSRNLRHGEPNELIISLCNLPLLSRRAKSGGFGDSIFLHSSESAGRIDSLAINESTSLKRAACAGVLTTPFPGTSFAGTRLRWQVREFGSGRIVREGLESVAPFTNRASARWFLDCRGLKPWHPKRPNLYTMELTWEKDDGTVLDRHTQRFGLRKWSSEGRVLKLNGKPIYIRQRYTGPQMPAHYRYPPSKDYWLKFFRLCKEVGYNSVDHYWIPTTHAFEAADEVGIIVQCGPGMLLAQKNAAGTELLRIPELWEGVVRYTRIYPSMSILCYGGEMAFYDGFLEDVARVSKMAHTVNPRILVLPNHAMRGIEYSQERWRAEDPGELSQEPFVHHAGRLAEITKHTDIFGHFRMGGPFSYGWIGPWSSVDSDTEIFQRPLIAHEPPCFSPSVAPYPADGKFNSLRYGSRDTARLIAEPLFGETEFRKWADPPLTHMVGGYKYDLTMKYVIEKIRKCGNMTGYQHLVGGYGWMFDQFLAWRPGNTLEKVLKYNGENILLLDWDNELCLKRSYWEGDTFNGTMMASIYGERPLKNGILTWTVRDTSNGVVLLQKTMRSKPLPNGKVSTMGDIEFRWPELIRNKKLNLSMRLVGSNYDISNDWDFWVFRKTKPGPVRALATDDPFDLLKDRHPGIQHVTMPGKVAPDSLWIVSALTEREVARLESGGDVLLLGHEPFPLHGWGKFQGLHNGSNLGSAVHPHPIFNRIPHEGWGNWQFAPLTARNILFQKMPGVPFDPILESVGFGGPDPRAQIFEFNAGKGRLFVANCPFTGDNPVRITLLDSILEYVTGPDFKPRSEIGLAQLRGLWEK